MTWIKVEFQGKLPEGETLTVEPLALGEKLCEAFGFVAVDEVKATFNDPTRPTVNYVQP